MFNVFGVMFLLLIYFSIIAVAVADYVITSISIYTLAKRQDIKYPGLAWVPVASDWIVGSLADKGDYLKGTQKGWRKVLLSLSIIAVLGAWFAYTLIIVISVISAFSFYMDSVVAAFTILVGILMVPISIVSIAYSVIKGICIYKIYDSFLPEKSVKYLLLYLLVPMAGAICLYKCKKNSEYVEIQQ